jgi:epsilon-lactone hydrolase
MASEQLKTLVAQLRANPVLSTDYREMRQGFEAMAQMFPIPEDVRREPVTAGGRPAEWVEAPGADPKRAVLYLHGGGYVIGSINTHRELASRISRASGARVLVLDYRLAPENPHPAAVEDAVSAYGWLLTNGLSPGNVVVAGDSAGGGLTLATLVALRDQGKPLPAAGVCLSPWVDLEGLGDSMTSRAAEDPMVQKAGLVLLAGLFLNGQDPRTPLAAPLHADLSGLPPLLIQVGTAETLLDDSLRLAERARQAGVDVKLEKWEELIHVFQLFAAMLPEGQQAIDRIGAFIREKTS